MATNTLNYDRKHAPTRKAQQEDAQRLERALRRYGIKTMTGQVNPARQIAALTKYLADLQIVRGELVDLLDGERAPAAFTRIDGEISQAGAQIARLKVSQIKPEV